MAEFRFKSIEPNEISVCITALDEDYTEDDRYIEWYIDDNLIYTMELPGGTPESDGIRPYGIPAFQTFKLKAVIYYDGGSKTLTETVTTRPEYFEFDTPKVKGKDYNLTDDEWNRLCDNINEVLQWVGKDSVYYMPATEGSDFLADMFNDVRNDLFDRLYIYMSDETKELFRTLVYVYPEDPVKASYLNGMRDIVNSIKYPYE